MRIVYRARQRKDENQSEIVAALRKVGVKVYVCGHPYDLLARWNGQWWVIEVKTESGRFRKSQELDMQELAQREKGECPVIVARNADDAMWAMGITRVG